MNPQKNEPRARTDAPTPVAMAAGGVCPAASAPTTCDAPRVTVEDTHDTPFERMPFGESVLFTENQSSAPSSDSAGHCCVRALPSSNIAPRKGGNG